MSAYPAKHTQRVLQRPPATSASSSSQLIPPLVANVPPDDIIEKLREPARPEGSKAGPSRRKCIGTSTWGARAAAKRLRSASGPCANDPASDSPPPSNRRARGPGVGAQSIGARRKAPQSSSWSKMVLVGVRDQHAREAVVMFPESGNRRRQAFARTLVVGRVERQADIERKAFASTVPRLRCTRRRSSGGLPTSARRDRIPWYLRAAISSRCNRRSGGRDDEG